MLKRSLLYIILACLSGIEIHAQAPQFSNYSSAQGLSNNTVNCIFQDHDGFMWIGTDFGLNRFDGREFKQYFHSEEEGSLRGNQISQIKQGRSGELLIGTKDGGFNVYNQYSNSFKQLKLADEFGVQNSHVLSITYDKDSALWVAFQKSGCVVVPKHGDVYQYTADSTLRKVKYYYDLMIATDSNLYAGTIGMGLLKNDGDSWSDVFVPDEFPYPGHTIAAICEDSSNNLWFGGWDTGLYKQALGDSASELVTTLDNESISYSDDEIKDLAEYKDKIWIGSRFSGLHIYDPASRQMTHCLPSLHAKGSIASKTINCLFEDDEGRMWIGTDRGLSVYDPKSFQFEVLFLEKSVGQVNASERVNAFAQSAEEIIVGSTGGLWIIKNDGSLQKKPMNFAKYNNMQVHSLLRSSHDGLLVGTNNSGYLADANFNLNEFNSYRRHGGPGEIRFSFFQIEASRIVTIAEGMLSDEPVYAFSPYGYGLMLFHRDTKVGTLNMLQLETSDEKRVDASLISKCFFDKSDRLWVFSEHGITIGVELRDPEEAREMWQFTPNRDSYFDRDSLGYGLLSASSKWDSLIPAYVKGVDVLEYDKDHFFITTNGHGLLEVILDDTARVNFVDAPQQVMEGIAKDPAGGLWILAAGGLHKFNVEDRTWQSFGPEDGFPDSGVSGDVFIDENGVGYAGGDGFVVRFTPQDLVLNQKKPKVKITGITIKNEDSYLLLKQENPTLDYKENALSFEFSALNFTNPQKNQFAYRLLGLESDWVYCGSQNSVRFADLQGGQYTFQVKAANNHGVWNEAPSEFKFYIRPPFWKRTLFWPFVILFILVLGTAFYFWRRKEWGRLEMFRLKGEMNGQENERKRLASELHDEVGTRLSVLKLYLNSIEKLSSDNQQSAEISQKAQDLLDEGVTDLRNMLHNLSPEAVHKFGFVKALGNLTERLNNAGDVQAHLEAGELEPRLSANVELTLYRVVQELINNTIKHANATDIHITVRQANAQMLLDYADNGTEDLKLNSQAEGGYGLRNIENRLHVIHATAKWLTKEQGMNVRIVVPLKHSES